MARLRDRDTVLCTVGRRTVKVILALLIPVVVWTVGSHHGNQFVFPGPSAVFERMRSQPVLIHVLTTFVESLLGLVLGSVLGVVFGFSLLRFDWLKPIAYQWILAFKALPVVVYAYLLAIYIGDNGIIKGMCVSALVCFGPMCVAVVESRLSIPAPLSDLVASYRSRSGASFWMLTVPWALHQVGEVLAIVVPLAVVGAMVSELGGGVSQGLGFLLMQASQRADAPTIFLSAILTLPITLGLLICVIPFKLFLLNRYARTSLSTPRAVW